MYDPLTREGLVCVNGRCISNKRKFQMHHEDQIGLHSGKGKNGRRRQGLNRRNARNGRRKGTTAGRSRHNGIPMNPYEDLDAIEEEQQLEDGLDEDYGEEDDYDEDGLLPFENQDELLDENFRDGNVYNYSGNKK